MENTLLIGLSRQVALERQLGVVANNIANVNTTGYKSDTAIFEEYLRSPAHMDNFTGTDRRLSFVVDRATAPQFRPGSGGAHRQPARCGARRQGLLRRPGQRQRALHPQRRVPDQFARPARHQRRPPGDGQQRADHLPARRPGHLDRPRRHHHRARGQQHQRRFDPRQAAAGELRPAAKTVRSRARTCLRRRTGRSPRQPSMPACTRARSRNRTSTASPRWRR